MAHDPNEESPPAAIFPAEGRPHVDLPGADRPEPRPEPDDDLPVRLGERIARDPVGVAIGEPDLLPDVDVPEAEM